MKKFYFSYSILFTVVALAATTSVVQSAQELRIVGREQSTHDDHPTTSVKQPSQELLIVGGEQSAPDDHPYFGKKTRLKLTIRPFSSHAIGFLALQLSNPYPSFFFSSLSFSSRDRTSHRAKDESVRFVQ